MSAIALACNALGGERGFPLITVYQAEVHKAGPQTFDLTQTPNGVLYFGNLHGLITYDGAWWRLTKLPDEQVALSVASDARGRVAAGLVNDFGIITDDAKGEPHYESLLPQLPAAKRERGDVRSVCPTGNGFTFLAEHAVIVWDGRTVRSFDIEPEKGPRGCFVDGPNVYLHGPNGLQRFDPATLRLSPSLMSGRVDAVVRGEGSKLIAAVRDVGLFTIDGNRVAPFSPAASEWLKGKMATSACRLADGRIVISTRQSGIAILDAAGNVEDLITDSAGLPDSVITSVIADREGSLWLAMEGPIARIDLASPVSVFDVRRSLKGSVSDVARFGTGLYVASTHGLYRIDAHSAVTRVEGIRDAWRLLAYDDDLLLGTSRGIYAWREGAEAVHVFQREGEIYDFLRSEADRSRVWVAHRHGLGSMRRTPAGWTYEEVLKDVPEYAGSVVERNGELWVGTVFDGVVRVRNPRTPAQSVTRFGDGETNVFEVGGRVVAVRASGEVFSVDAQDRYVRDPLLGHISAPRGFFILAEDARKDVWINSTPPRMFQRLPNGTYAAEGKPLVSVNAADIQTMRMHADGVVWFASDKGLFRYEPSTNGAPVVAQPPPLIRNVVAGEDRVIHGRDAVTLPHDFGRMRVEFAPVAFRPGVEYQYRLDPIDSDWSHWTDQPFIDYTTLEAHDYTFRLRARGPSMVPSGEVRWSFQVLPPWYRTAWAYALWALLLAGAVLLVIRIRTATLRTQAERLRQRVAAKTAELQETVQLLEQANARLETLSLEDELTGIANRRYFERSLSDEWNRARRRDQPLALILLDLDYFKDLNDRRGHPAGDECLRRVGAFLAQTIRRSGEVVARYGGEEFAVLLPGVDADGAVTVAESLRAGIERLGGVTTSCGVAALIPAGNASSDALVALADGALYAAKHSGRNCVRVADDSATGTWLRDASA